MALHEREPYVLEHRRNRATVRLAGFRVVKVVSEPNAADVDGR